MRLTTPRIMPAADNDLTEEQREIVAPMQARGSVLNIFRTLLNHPAAAKGFLGWGSYVLSRKNTLPPREREIVILRTGFLCRSGYEWTQHVPIGKRAGLTDDEIARIKLGADAPAGARPIAPCCGPPTICTAISSSANRSGRRCRNISANASAWTWCSRSASTPRSR